MKTNHIIILSCNVNVTSTHSVYIFVNHSISSFTTDYYCTPRRIVKPIVVLYVNYSQKGAQRWTYENQQVDNILKSKIHQFRYTLKLKGQFGSCVTEISLKGTKGYTKDNH